MGSSPIDRAEDNRKNMDGSLLVLLYGSLYLTAIDIVRVEKVRTDEQKHNRSIPQIRTRFALHLTDIMFIETHAVVLFKLCEKIFQCVCKSFVFSRICQEESYCRKNPPFAR